MLFHLYVHDAYPCPCLMSMSMLYVHLHAGCPCLSQIPCPCPCCLSVSMLHVHVHAACPCPCCMPMFMLLSVCVCMCVCVCVCLCINARMPDSQASYQSSTRMKKTNDAGTNLVLDQADIVRHFFGPYWTEIMDAGMPMPELVSSMLMPSYAPYICALKEPVIKKMYICSIKILSHF